MPLQAYQIDPEETTDVSGVRTRAFPACPRPYTFAAPGLPWILGRETASDCARLRRKARARRAIGAIVGLAFALAAPVTGWLASIA